MTRSEAINLIQGMKADNLNLSDAYTKDKYEALGIAIKALEQDQKIGHWISHIEHCEMNNLRPSGLGSYFWCSECDCGIENGSFGRVNYNYCPECGAKIS